MSEDTSTWTNSDPLVVPDSLANWVFNILDGKRPYEPDNSFLIPVDARHVFKCVFCLSLTMPITVANGREFDATVTKNVNGTFQADLLHPHDCPEGRRYQEFLDSPEPEFSEPEFKEEF